MRFCFRCINTCDTKIYQPSFSKVLDRVLIPSKGQQTSLLLAPFNLFLQINESLIYFPISPEIGFCKFLSKALSCLHRLAATHKDSLPFGALHEVGTFGLSVVKGLLKD